ncbi:hypothetical protein E3Q13_02882 [Wallemia mellicola]|uniref:Integrase catalytic domain-containing protein n=1 Tax=Wallemia mellicola TaxID=1708541 RepID=A0AB38MVL6_9BASI|nr:hypothetical protein E3Q13_02882 [Wallemia mellicola]TIC64355.1 hypothetical protein E3Q02_02638 [Wallemia mellicola]
MTHTVWSSKRTIDPQHLNMQTRHILWKLQNQQNESAPFDGALDKTNQPLDILHSDMTSIQQIPTKKYALVVIDEYTRYTWTFALKYKNCLFATITHYIYN